VWLLRPPSDTADCGAAVASVSGCECEADRSDCADCGDLQSCVSSIIAGVREQGIRPGSAELIRLDAFDAAGGAPGGAVRGMRLRFEQRMESAKGGTLYEAQIVLVPGNGGTRIATLITADRGDSYECFDAANAAFRRFVEMPCG
jgi:hypothetical protein